MARPEPSANERGAPAPSAGAQRPPRTIGAAGGLSSGRCQEGGALAPRAPGGLGAALSGQSPAQGQRRQANPTAPRCPSPIRWFRRRFWGTWRMSMRFIDQLETIHS